MDHELTPEQLAVRLDRLEHQAIRLDRYANQDANSMPHMRTLERELKQTREVILSHDAALRAERDRALKSFKEIEWCVRAVGEQRAQLALLRQRLELAAANP